MKMNHLTSKSGSTITLQVKTTYVEYSVLCIKTTDISFK